MRVELIQAFVLMGGLGDSDRDRLFQGRRLVGGDARRAAGAFELDSPAERPSVPWPALFISLPLAGFYFWGLSQTMVQRTLSARDTNHGRWGNLLAGALNFVIFFLMILPGIAGRVLYPDLEKGDQVYPKLVFEMLPPGLLGLVLIGFIAAMTSVLTFDAQLGADLGYDGSGRANCGPA